MQIGDMALLVGAGMLGGLCNAIAGGGIFFTFPALLAVGLPPVTASATSAVAIWPGHAASLIGESTVLRQELIARPRRVVGFTIASAGGAALLIASGDVLFQQLIPSLLLFATFLLVVGPALNRWLSKNGVRIGARAAALAEGMVAVYGGYFGAGLGVLLLALLMITGSGDLSRQNTVKNGLATLATSTAVLIFVLGGRVVWEAAILVFLGAAVGGVLGGRLARRLNPQVLRYIVVCLGLVLAWHYA